MLFAFKKFVFAFTFNFTIFLMLMIGIQNSARRTEVDLIIGETVRILNLKAIKVKTLQSKKKTKE